MEYLHAIRSNDEYLESSYNVVDVYNKRKYHVKRYLPFLTTYDNTVPFHLAELPMFPSPVLVDVDIKKQSDVVESLYNEEMVREILLDYVAVLDEHLTSPPEKYTVLLLEKPARLANGVVKNGFHLHFISVSLQDLDLKIIYDYVKARSSHAALLDDVSTKAWLMYGASKSPEERPYKVTKAYVVEKGAVVQVVDDYKTLYLGHTYAGTKITQANVDTYKLAFMSIRNSRNFSLQRPNKVKLESMPVINENAYVLVDSSELSNSAPSVDDGVVEELVLSLKDERSDDYNDWIKVGMILADLAKKRDNEDFFKSIYHRFSERSDKYDHKEVNDRWRSFMKSRIREGGVTVGTLIHMAKVDGVNIREILLNPDPEFIPTLDVDIAERIKKYVTKAYMTHKVYGCYEFDTTIWVKVRDWENEFRLHVKSWINGYAAMLRKEELNDVQNKALCKLQAKVKNLNTLNSVVKALFNEYYNKRMPELFEQKPSLIAFRNCVFNVKEWAIEQPNPDHYLIKRVEHDLMMWDSIPPTYKAFVNDFFSKLFPDNELREYTVKNIARFFTGKNAFKHFQFWTGEGNNGKSVFISLLEMVFGRFIVKSPKSLITGVANKLGGATPEIARLNDTRITVIDELTSADHINTGIVKNLSGGCDKLYGRDLYKGVDDIVEIKPAFFPIGVANVLPTVVKGDQAFYNRVRVIDFESTFVNDVDEYCAAYPDADESKVFQMDHDIDDKLLDHSKYFLSYFLYILMKHKSMSNFNGKEVIPEKVSIALTRFIESQNLLKQYLDETFAVDATSSEMFSFGRLMLDFNNSKSSGSIKLTLKEVESCMANYAKTHPGVVVMNGTVRGLTRLTY